MTAAERPLPRAEAARLLGVAEDATPTEVQRAFLRAARRVHPDVLPDADEARRRAAAAEFDGLRHARDLLLTTPPGSTAPSPAVSRATGRAGRGLGDSLVVLALLAFLLVALVTVQQGLRGEAVGSGDGPAGSSAP